jgi:hypothetical protein
MKIILDPQEEYAENKAKYQRFRAKVLNPGSSGQSPRKTARLPNGDVADVNFNLTTNRSATSKVVNVMAITK